MYRLIVSLTLNSMLLLGCLHPSNPIKQKELVKIFNITVPEESIVYYSENAICVEYLHPYKLHDIIYTLDSTSLFYKLEKFNGDSPSPCAQISVYKEDISNIDFFYDESLNPQHKVIKHDRIQVVGKRNDETGIYKLYLKNKANSFLLQTSPDCLDLDFRLLDIEGDSKAELIVYQYFPSRISVDVKIEGYLISF